MSFHPGVTKSTLSFRTRIGTWAGRLTAWAIRVSRRGRATNLPGKVALRLAPNVLAELARGLPEGVVLVSATNGKTTTAAMISHILGEQMVVCRNSGGANLVAGVVTALVTDPKNSQIGVFEVDEAALSIVAAACQPRLIVLSNLFRDQLDRHGELQMVARKWRAMVAALSSNTELVLGADDPLVAGLAAQPAELGSVTSSKPATYFGFDDKTVGVAALSDSADSTFCEICSQRLSYEAIYMAHLGEWNCKNCGRGRPRLDVWADEIQLQGLAGLKCRVNSDLKVDAMSAAHAELTLGLPGLYNLANALAAIATCLRLGISLSHAVSQLSDFSTAFGRFEKISLSNKTGYMILMKNPTGANQILRTIADDLEGAPLVLVLNDAIADGQDVSWIWDVDFEGVVNRAAVVICSGSRADEMAVRMTYAGVAAEKIKVVNQPVVAVKLAASQAHERPFFILPTYTAMFELSKTFGTAPTGGKSSSHRGGV